MTRPVLAAIAIVATVVTASPLHAQEGTPPTEDEPESAEPVSSEEDLEQLTFRAEELFRDGDHDGALRLLNQAYEIEQDPKTLYNIARVHEENGDLEQALEHYDEFVVSEGVNAKNRRLAMRRVKKLREQQRAELEAEAKRREEHQPARDPAPSEVTVAPLSKSTSIQRPAPPVVERPSNRETWRRIGIGLSALGVAAAGTGTVFGVLSLRGWNQADDASDPDVARQRREQASQNAAIADTLFISGGVVGLTGLAITVASWPGLDSADNSTAGRVRIGVGPNRVQATWRF